MIYLDNNATTPVDPEVRLAMKEALEKGFGNPSSSHAAGRLARGMVEDARLRVSALIGANPGEVIFTSGGTESNNLAIIGTALARGSGHIITSAVEHPSVTNAVRHLESMGFAATYAGVARQCRVIPGEILGAIRKDTILITIMHSNNETGTLQPVEEIASIANSRGIRFHTDAAQSAGKVKVSAEGVALMTVASHKLYGPKGAGALFIRDGVELSPIMFGAGHERGLRPGTENVPGIVGLGKACEIALRDIERRIQSGLRLSSQLLEGFRSRVKGTRLNGHETKRLPGTLNLCFKGTDAFALVESLRDEVAISAGSACHSGVCRPSPVLKAMGLADSDALASVRISIGKDNSEEDVANALETLSGRISPQGRAP
jgi:cysteine desulfurase